MNILITGTTSGLGKAMANALKEQHNVIAWNLPQVDISNPGSIENAFSSLPEEDMPDCIINNAGVNYINWLEKTPNAYWDMLMNTNAKAIFLISKLFAPHLQHVKGTIVNITSNAAWVPMTNSICYNASKGAAHIMTLQLARELSPKGVTVFGIAPNKLKGTGMSQYIDNTVCNLRGWTPEEAEGYQLKALPAGAETPPEQVADFVRYLLQSKEHHRYLTGTIIPYGK